MPDTSPDSGKPTIRDVARRAGVSVGTVSNVLNRRIPVTPKRRLAVEKAIAELGFRPNRIAQSLRGRAWRVVGLVAGDAHSAYFAALLDRFETMGASLGYEVMQVLDRGDPAIELRRTRALLDRQVDGLILVPTARPQAVFDVIAESGVPAVMVDREFGDPRFDYVTMDNSGAMAALVRELAARGGRRFLFVVRWPDLVTTRARIAAFERTARETGIAATVLARDPDDAVFVRQVAQACAGAARPDTIVASNSTIALPLLAILARLGLAIPKDVSFVAFDEPIWAPVVAPPLSVVRHPVDAIARSAWEILIDRIERGTPAGRRIVHAAEIVLRGSVRGEVPPEHRE
ncbi:MAG: LacI family transcriptional regulator [Tagaea sp.]|nr:LacI family transcriptional regulator [Tagaea sp.]